jgi:hypothetical protein
MDKVSGDLDDILTTLPYVRENGALTDRLFEQVVDLLVEQIVDDLRQQYDGGQLSARAYAIELATLAGQARAVGLIDH